LSVLGDTNGGYSDEPSCSLGTRNCQYLETQMVDTAMRLAVP